MIYSNQIETRFRNPGYPGAAQPIDLTGRAETPGSAAVLQLYLQIENGRVMRASFQAFGCPACIAAGDWACEWLTGRKLVQINTLNATQIESALELAPAKRHVALLVEDALANALTNTVTRNPP